MLFSDYKYEKAKRSVPKLVFYPFLHDEKKYEFSGAMTHSNGTTNGTVGENGESREIDEGLYSRQLFVLGRHYSKFVPYELPGYRQS